MGYKSGEVRHRVITYNMAITFFFLYMDNPTVLPENYNIGQITI